MNDSSFIYPSILQAVLIVLAIFVLHFVAKITFSFIDNDTLVNLLAEVFKLAVLLIFIRYLIRNQYIDKGSFVIEMPQFKVVLIILICIASIKLLPLPTLSFFKDEQYMEIVNNVVSNQIDIFSFIYMIMVVPIFEEIIFRGIILKGFLQRYSPATAILISSLLFGLINPFIGEPFLGALFMGWVYYKSGNLIYCIIIHAFANFSGFVVSYGLHYNYFSFESLAFLNESNWMRMLVFLTIIGACIYGLKNMLKDKSVGGRIAID